MIVKTYDSTSEFTKDDWSKFHSGEFYYQYEILRILELSKINEAEFRFITFSHSGAPKGAVILSSFKLQLDLLSENFLFRFLKFFSTALIKIPIACNGLPVSIGQNKISVLDNTFYDEILDLTTKEVEIFAREKKCKVIAWKELSSDFKGVDKLYHLNYVKFPTSPNTKIEAKEHGFDKYLSLLRSSYRRKFKRPIENKGKKGGLAVLIKPFTSDDITAFYSGYIAVLNRAKVKTEVYSKAFFELLVKESIRVEVITVSSDEGSISALIIPDVHALNFLMVSKEKENYDHALYAELIRSIVIYGLEKGYQKIHMGKYSYYAKMCSGAQAEPLNVFIKSYNPFIKLLIEHFGNFMFSETALPIVNPFKKF